MGQDDDALPALAVLTGPRAARVLEPALPGGARIQRLDPVQVTGAPGRRTTVRYDAEVVTPDGWVTTEILVAAVNRAGLPHGPRRVDHAGEEIAVFRAPDDPRLPALAEALDEERVAAR